MPSAKHKLWLCQNCETLNPLSSQSCEVCGDKMPREFRPPIIKTFKSSSKVINNDENLTISWSTENAKYVSLNGVRVAANGKKEILATETIILKASNPNGKVEKKIDVKVLYNLELLEFTISDEQVLYGNQCLVTWKARNLKRVVFNGRERKPDSSITLKPKKSRSYSVIFEGFDGVTIQKDFNLEVVYPKPLILINMPDYGEIGKTTQISWNTENVSHVIIDGKKYAEKSSIKWIYSKEEQCKIIAFYGLDGNPIYKEVRIREGLTPNITSCTLSGYMFKYGDECTVKWEGDYVTSWYINAEHMYSNRKKSASFKVLDNIISVHFIGENGAEIIKEIPIDVIYEPKVKKCEVSTKHPQKGKPCIIEWETEHIVKVNIGRKTYPAVGSYTFIPQKNSEIVIEFVGERGEILIEELFVELPPIRITLFKANTDNVLRGNVCTISWNADNVDFVKIKDVRYQRIGSYSFTPFQPEKITAYFYGSDGTILERSLNINVRIPEIYINSLRCSQYNNIKRGQTVTFTWNSSNVKYITIDGHTGRFHPCGTKDIIISKDTSVCFNFFGDNGKKQTRTINLRVKKRYGCLIIFLLIALISFMVSICVLKPSLFNSEFAYDFSHMINKFLHQHGLNF